MKKYTLVGVLLMLSFLSSFAQLQIVDQKLLTLSKKDETSIVPLGKNGFMLIQKTKSEESKNLRKWTFTIYSTDLAVLWTKSIDYEDDLDILEFNTSKDGVNIIFYINNGLEAEKFRDGRKVGDLTVMKININGEITKKDIELKDKIKLFKGNFVGDAYYFDAILKKEDVIMKIDFANMSLTSNKFTVPEYTDIVARTTDGKNIYFKVKSYKKKIPYDALYTFEDCALVDKTNLKTFQDEDIVSMNIIRPDADHKFMLGLSRKEILGETQRDDIIKDNYYITNLNNNDLNTINKIDVESSDMLNDKRNLKDKKSLLNIFIRTSQYEAVGNFNMISSCFRINGKNIVVFDKYQIINEVRQVARSNNYNNSGINPKTGGWATPRYNTGSRGQSTYRTVKEFIGYYFTNSVVWCFNDAGEVEWSKNFEYDIFSPELKPKTCATPYKENSIALLGNFNKGLSYKTISLSGEVEEDLESQNASNTTKIKNVYSIKNSNSISHLYGNKFLVWGRESDFNMEKENTSFFAKKDYDVLLQIVEFE